MPFNFKEPADAQQSFSSNKQPTVWRIIPVLEYLVVRWEDMASQSKYYEISESIEAGLDNLAKWYRTTDDSDAYFVCMGM